MAYHDTHAAPAASFAHRLVEVIKATGAVIGAALVGIAVANRRLRLVERLNEKSDAELAALGMRREDIIRHVFTDMIDT